MPIFKPASAEELARRGVGVEVKTPEAPKPKAKKPAKKELSDDNAN